MPSRVFPPDAHDEGTSTASTSSSHHPRSESKESSTTVLTEELRSKSGTQHQRSQSTAEASGFSSSTTAEHLRCETSKPALTPLGPKSRKQQRPTSSPSQLQSLADQLSPPAASYFTRQPGASGIDARSPFTRRAPASRSSNGIETLSGPPPALSTQRSYTADSARSHAPPLDLTQNSHQARKDRPRSAKEGTTTATAGDRFEDGRSVRLDGKARMTLPKRARDEFTFEEEQDQRTLRGNDFSRSDQSDQRAQVGHDRLEKRSPASQEDLFLHMAQTDAAANADLDRKQRRRSRMSNASPQPPVSYRPSSSRQSELGSRDTLRQMPWMNRENGSPRWQSEHLSQNSPDTRANRKDEPSHAISAYSLEQRARVSHSRFAPRASLNASRARRPSTRETSPELPTFNAGRRYSVEPSPDPPSSARQSNHLFGASDQYHSSPLNGYSFLGQRQARRMSRADGTESTISTNAPSVILEQLDDLNARIKKLELNGKMPSTSSAAMSSIMGERPPTATTTLTTMSPSPKRSQMRNDSPEASTSTVKGPVDTDIHPLLHSALSKSKDLVSPEVFSALEATTSDALTLAAMTSGANSEADSEPPDNAMNGVDRRLRHKANSMCRSLTELCIALSDMKKDAQNTSRKSRPQSRDTANTAEPSKPLAIEQARSVRAASVEPELRTSSRVMSRLEARRTSQMALNAQVGRRESSPFESSIPTLPAPPASGSRSSSVMLGQRISEFEPPHSRAIGASEIPQPYHRPSPHERASREYTSQHPLPSHQQRSPSVQSSLPQRKSYFLNGNTSSPITPSYQSQDRRNLDSTPPSSGAASRLAEARHRREASQRMAGGGTRAGLLNIRAGASDIPRGPP